MKAFHAGLTWVFTPMAKGLLLDLVAQDFSYDLAVEFLHQQVESGFYVEAEIYELPEPEEELELIHEA